MATTSDQITPGGEHSSVCNPSYPLLPPELIAIVYDCLLAKRDLVTLGICGVLSQSHVTPIRKRLFSTISLRLHTQPRSVSIRDLVRRIKGLTTMFQRDEESRTYTHTLEILDSFPVYDSQWITQQPCLPTLLDLFPNVRTCTFGCEVGYLDWGFFTPKLKTSLTHLFLSPHLKTLSLCNLGNMPTSLFDSAVSYLYLKNITTLHHSPVTINPSAVTLVRRLSYLNVQSMAMVNTESAWGVMQTHASSLKMIKLRVWEDHLRQDGSTLPGSIDLSQFRALKMLSVRMTFGSAGRDLQGLSSLLSLDTAPLGLWKLEIDIRFPNQRHPHLSPDIRDHAAWKILAEALRPSKYMSLKQVTMVLTVHEKKTVVNGKKENSLVEFRKQMQRSAFWRFATTSTIRFKFKVRSF